MEMIQIRKATLEDASLLAELGSRTFRDAYGADNNFADMEKYLSEAFSTYKMQEELQEPTSQFFIAFDNLRAVGYTKLRNRCAIRSHYDACVG